jgi:hypothetical protein
MLRRDSFLGNAPGLPIPATTHWQLLAISALEQACSLNRHCGDLLKVLNEHSCSALVFAPPATPCLIFREGDPSMHATREFYLRVPAI